MSGGWLRPAVFGAMDGLVTNVSLIAGVGGGGGSQHAILLTGLAGLAAGAFSMAAGRVRVGLLAERAGPGRGGQGTARADPQRRRRAGRARRACCAAAASARPPRGWPPRRSPRTPTRRSPSTRSRNSASTPPSCPRRTSPPGASLAAFAVGALIPLLPVPARLRRAVAGARPVRARRGRRRRPGGAADQPAVLARCGAPAGARRARRGRHVPDRPRRRRDGRLTRQERFTPPATWPRTRSRRRTSAPAAPPGTRAARYDGCSPTMSTCAPATGTGPARPTPAATTRPFPWPRRSPNWPRRSARWTAYGGCTAGKLRSTPPSLPPASASSCGSGRCTSRCIPGGKRRLEVLMPGPYRRALFMAAIFPEVAALAAGPPRRARRGQPAQRRPARLRYAEPPGRHDVSDTLSIWARDREAGWAYGPTRHTLTRVTMTTARPHHRRPPYSRAADRHPLAPGPPRALHPHPGIRPCPTSTCLVRGPLLLSCWPPCPPEAGKSGSRGNGWVSGTHIRRRCPGESGSERLLAACPPQPIPPAAGRFDRLPVACAHSAIATNSTSSERPRSVSSYSVAVSIRPP